MPATAVSEAVSWGLYLAAAASIATLLLPSLHGAYLEASALAANSSVDGMARVLDGLEPGLTVTLTYSSPQGFPVLMSGHILRMDAAGREEQAYCTWFAQPATLVSGRTYVFSLNGSSVVTSDG